jgi:hypothetical protein
MGAQSEPGRQRIVCRDACVRSELTTITGPGAGTSHVGAYFLVVNPAKRQYLDPGRFGEPVKFSNVLAGDYCFRALKLLIADCFRREGVSFRGAWLGDPVILASDDTGLPDPGGLITTTAASPERNLNALARDEFTDISYRALAELCRDAEVAEELAKRAKGEESFLVDLGAVLIQYHQITLERALERTVGRLWRKVYNQAIVSSYRQPLMPIDWPLP